MDITRPAVEKARFVDVEKFLESRKASIAELLKAIDNANLVSGEVTKGPRTVAQRLPRHMRRRAMAYNVKRFPRAMRNYAGPIISTSKHRKKPPSRFARRRPSKLMETYTRRQQTNGRWLETHIWHAKRFRMMKRWGVKIAQKSYQRGHRATVRHAEKTCSIRDHSFFTCFIFTSKNPHEILKVLNKMSDESCGRTFSSCREHSEVLVQLYRPQSYPHGYIGPARVTVSNKSVIVWAHPSIKTELVEIWKQADLFGFDETHLLPLTEGAGDGTVTYDWKTCRLDVLDAVLNRFSLNGPKSLRVLAKSIRLKDDPEYETSHKEWKSISSQSPTTLADGRVIELMIEDPRTCWDTDRHQQPSTSKTQQQSPRSSSPRRNIWSAKARKEARDKQLTPSEYQERNADTIGGVKSTRVDLPISVVIRNRGRGILNGIDVICPSGFGKDFWVALQRRGACASGADDELAAAVESTRHVFPRDAIGANACEEFEKADEEEQENKHLARPHNRRTKFWSDMSIKHPFSGNWSELVGGGRPFVCRSPTQLLYFSNFLRGKATFDPQMFENPTMLLPIVLQPLARGRPKRLGIICLPGQDDYERLRKSIRSEIIQPRRVDTSDVEMAEASDGEEEEVAAKKPKMEGFVSLNPAANEKSISLKDIFASTVVDKSDRKKLRNRKKKEKAKKRVMNRVEQRHRREEEEKQMEEIAYVDSASRTIIGRMTDACQSLLGGKGTAVGFVAASSLPKIVYKLGGSLVLYRNATSRYYHPAHIAILDTPLDIWTMSTAHAPGTSTGGGSKIDQLSKDDLVKFAKKQLAYLADLKKQNATMTETMTSLSKKYEQSQTECQQLKSAGCQECEKNKEKSSRADVLSLEITDLESKIDVLNKSLKQRTEALSKAQEVIAENDRIVAELRTSSESTKEVLQQFETKCVRLTQELADEKKLTEQLSSNLKKAEQQWDQQSEQQGTEKIGLARQLAAGESRITTLEEAVTTLRDSNCRLKSERDEMQERMLHLQEEFSAFKSKAHFVLEQRGRTEDKGKESEERVAVLTAQLEEARSELEEVKGELASSIEQLSTCTLKLAEVERNLEVEREKYLTSKTEHVNMLENVRVSNANSIRSMSDEVQVIKKARETADARFREAKDRADRAEHALLNEKERAEMETSMWQTKANETLFRLHEVEKELQEARVTASTVAAEGYKQRAIAAVTPQQLQDDQISQVSGATTPRPFPKTVVPDFEVLSVNEEPQERSLEDILYGQEDPLDIESDDELTIEKFNELVDDLEKAKATTEHMNELLAELEQTNGRLVVQNKFLKEEIRRIERTSEREQELSNEKNLEYLKNVVVQILKPEKPEKERAQLIVVIERILHLSPEETAVLQQFAQKMAELNQSSSWGSYLGWSS